MWQDELIDDILFLLTLFTLILENSDKLLSTIDNLEILTDTSRACITDENNNFWATIEKN